MRTYRGANVDSDHYLVVAKIKAKLSMIRSQRSTRSPKYNTERLKDPDVRDRYVEVTNEKFRRTTPKEDVDQDWEVCKSTLKEAAKEVLGYETHKKINRWFDQECQDITNAKNNAYRMMIQRRHSRRSVAEYREKRRQEKLLHRRKKRKWEADQLVGIENLRRNNEVRRFYREVNASRKPFKPFLNACRDTDGNLLNVKQNILERWRNHFESMLNDGVENRPPQTIPPTTEDLEPPDFDEVQEAVEYLRNNKATGADGLPSELIKYSGEEVKKALHNIIMDVWTSEKMPADWYKTII